MTKHSICLPIGFSLLLMVLAISPTTKIYADPNQEIYTYKMPSPPPCVTPTSPSAM